MNLAQLKLLEEKQIGDFILAAKETLSLVMVQLSAEKLRSALCELKDSELRITKALRTCGQKCENLNREIDKVKNDLGEKQRRGTPKHKS